MNDATILQRLRQAGLRPTTARIAVLQIMVAADLRALDTEEVFRRALDRGAHVGLSAVYQALRRMEAHGLLLREWSRQRKALYRLKPGEAREPVLVLVCRESGRHVPITDPVLHERLRAAVQDMGLLLAGRQVLVEVEEDDAEAHRPGRGFVAAPGGQAETRGLVLATKLP